MSDTPTICVLRLYPPQNPGPTTLLADVQVGGITIKGWRCVQKPGHARKIYTPGRKRADGSGLESLIELPAELYERAVDAILDSWARQDMAAA